MLPRLFRSAHFFEVLSHKLRPWSSHRLRGILRKHSVSVLVSRPDRLGDVILSTPVVEMMKKRFPKVKITFLVRDSVAPVLRGIGSIHEVFIYDPEGRHLGFSGFFRLVGDFRQRQFRFGIALQSNWKIAAAMSLAGIPHRIGPLSKLHSYLLYNAGIRQRRSQVEMHEADYNLQLLKKLGIQVSTRAVATRVHLSEEQYRLARAWLETQGWSVQGGQTVVVHPGMGGSALNWPEVNYHELAKILVQEGFQVIITGGPSETSLLERMQISIADALARAPGKLIFFKNTDFKTVDFLAGLFRHAQVVVAPSTGPLHLAVALNIPVVTFYPPIRVQSAVRWGPYLADESRASVLVPEVYCGQDFHCLGSACHFYPCMRGLSVAQAIQQVRVQLQQSAPHPSSAAVPASSQ